MSNEKNVVENKKDNFDLFGRLSACPENYSVVVGFQYATTKDGKDYLRIELCKSSRSDGAIGCVVENVFVWRSSFPDFDTAFTDLCVGSLIKFLYVGNGTFKVLDTVLLKN